uniref:Uncharacterized protein n=1 Tax=Arundo donax TaxID=35708 RepID=A0A0A9AVD1_ARUDO
MDFFFCSFLPRWQPSSYTSQRSLYSSFEIKGYEKLVRFDLLEVFPLPDAVKCIKSNKW